MPARSGAGVKILLAAFALAIGGSGLSSPASSSGLPGVQLTQQNLVPGCVTPKRLMQFLRAYNPRLDRRYARISELYVKYGRRLGVRWDVAFFQMMIETANLSFRAGNVPAQYNNFASLGAIGDGNPGERFASIELGVRAHIEHVLHYAGAKVLEPVAERTRKVQEWRVLAEWHQGFERPITYSDLAARWSLHATSYGEAIERLAEEYQNRYCDGQPAIVLRGSTRPPEIAATAWRFEKAAGLTPPTGQPNLDLNRESLGVGRPVAVALTAPRPRPVTRPLAAERARRKPAERARRVSLARPAPQQKPATANPSRPVISADDRIRQMISDRKILLRTHVGAVVPIVYDADGEMRGQAGSLAFFLGSSRDKGRWWVAKGKLCQKWRIWLDRETYCMTLKERRGTIWWRADDGKRGTARVVSR